jgi:hypothetical protein
MATAGSALFVEIASTHTLRLCWDYKAVDLDPTNRRDD